MESSGERRGDTITSSSFCSGESGSAIELSFLILKRFIEGLGISSFGDSTGIAVWESFRFEIRVRLIPRLGAELCVSILLELELKVIGESFLGRSSNVMGEGGDFVFAELAVVFLANLGREVARFCVALCRSEVLVSV